MNKRHEVISEILKNPERIIFPLSPLTPTLPRYLILLFINLLFKLHLHALHPSFIQFPNTILPPLSPLSPL